MGFRMKRPLKMAGPRPSALKLGRVSKTTGGSARGVFYNSTMGPMKMVSPSALKQAEEEMAMGGGMEELMGMMGGGEAPVDTSGVEAPVEPVQEEKEGEGEGDGVWEKGEPWIFGQETGEVYKDEHGLYVIMGEGDDMYRGTDPNYDQKLYIPNEFVEELGAVEGDMIDDRDIGYEKVDGRWTIIAIDMGQEEER